MIQKTAPQFSCFDKITYEQFVKRYCQNLTQFSQKIVISDVFQQKENKIPKHIFLKKFAVITQENECSVYLLERENRKI